MHIKGKTVVYVALLLIMLFCVPVFAADVSPLDGFDDHDYDQLQTFLNAISDDGVHSNGQILNAAYVSTDATTWTGVTWNADVSKRVTTIDWYEEGDLAGSLDVSGFTALTSIEVGVNAITALDVTGNTALTYLGCQYNDLTTIDVTTLTALTDLDCRGNQLTSININNNTALVNLDCAFNNITSVDVNNNVLLESLICKNNSGLTTLVTNGAVNLLELDCSFGSLTTISISSNTSITNLNVSGNNLSVIDVALLTNLMTFICTNNALTTIDVTANTALVTFSCGGNLLTMLNVSNNTLLTYLLCSYNTITSLDLSSNTLLEYLYTDSNSLTALDASNNPAIIDIYASDNNILTVDVASNIALSDLRLAFNNLTSLSLAANTGLAYLDIEDNNITTLDPAVSTALHTINASNNQLSSVSLSANTSLVTLDLANNNLTSVNVSGSPLLITLKLNDNSLGNITLTGNTQLNTLYVQNNNLTSLDTSASPSLTILQALDNPIRQLDTEINGATISVTARGLGTVGLSFHNLISRLYTEATANPTFAFFDWTDEGTGTTLAVNTRYDLTFGTDYDINANFTAGVIFDENGGDTPADPAFKSTVAGSTITPPATPPGYTGLTFEGWYKEPEGINEWIFATDTVPASGLLTLYAKWSGTFTVSFNVNGGHTPYSPVSEDVTYGQTVTEPVSDPTRTGYGFTGWYTDAATTNAWGFADPVITAMTLYAGWDANPYTVTFDENGGDTAPVPTFMVVDYDALIDPQPIPPTKVGFGFAGWYKEIALTNKWDFTTDTMDGDRTLYAKWGLFYTVTYDNTTGDTEANPISEVILEDNTIPIAPTPPTKVGYDFDGWYKDVTLINEWNFATDVVTTHTTLYAKWVPSEYIITFNNNGGTTQASPQTMIAYYGLLIAPQPIPPDRTGHAFDGWYKEAATVNLWSFATETVTGDTTLYAKWTPEIYTVTFDENGGTISAIPDTMSVEYDTLIPSLPTAPRRPGYALDEWCTDIAGTNLWDFLTDHVMGPLTLYAKWAPAHTVTFNNNGGATQANPQTMEIIDGRIIGSQPAPPTRVGYTFTGWYTDVATTIEWVFATDIVSSDTTLYAGWSPIAYTITYDENGGDTPPAPTTTIAYFDALIIITPTTSPTLAGFVFDAWYADAATTILWDFSADTVAGDTTLYAGYAPYFTVTFDENGGTVPANPPTIGIVQGRLIETLPTEPIRAGYYFDAWYKDAANTLLWDFATDTVDDDTTLYASWTAIYNVTFDENGGETPAVPPNTQTLDGTTISMPGTSPTRTGYAFSGWFTELATINQWDFSTDLVTTNMTLYAGWAPLDYTITFNENGGDSLAIPNTMLAAYNTLISPQPIPPIRAGYTLGGWFTDAAANTEWDFATDRVQNNLTLYAGWVRSYLITFNRNGGSQDAIPDSMVVVSGELISPQPTPPSRTGYTFSGWYREYTTTSIWDFAVHVVTGNTVLYAGWTPISYTVIFDENGGDTAAFPATMTVEYANLIGTRPGEPTLAGSAFVGWFTNAAGTISWDFDTNLVTSNMTLYAAYVPLVTVTFDENGGDTPAIPATMAIGQGMTIDTPPTPPTLADYVFVGWFVDAALTIPWTLATDTVGSDLTLFAGWTDVTYTVTFDTTGGTATGSIVVANGAIISPQPAPPTRADYIFEGWYLDEGGASPWNFGVNTVSGNVTLYALWSEALALSGSPSSGDIYKEGRIEITPNISGGIWSYNPEDVSVEFIGSRAVFTGLTLGDTTVTYTVDGQTAQFTISVSDSALPTTGQNYNLLIVLAGLIVAVAGALVLLLTKQKANA